MAHQSDARMWWSEPLVWAAGDCEMKKVLDEALTLLARCPAILTRIEADQDRWAKAKKKIRQADQRWQAAQTLPLPGLVWDEAPAPSADTLELASGRPRMGAELVYVCSVLRGYLGSLTDQAAKDRLLDSTTLHLYWHSRGLYFPGWTTMVENVNALSKETRHYILDAQLAMILDEGLDDFSQALLDSTAVEANSAWPTDARILLGLLERAFRRSQQLTRFGLSNIPKWWVPQWLKKLRQLLFKINNTVGQPKSKGNLKKHYRQFLHNATKILAYFLPYGVDRDPVQEAADRPPSQQALVGRLWDRLIADLSDACAVYQYTEERIFEGKVRPAAQKRLSLADDDAAFITSVIGYKPQLVRSEHGFIPALIVPQGNEADSPQLVPLVRQIKARIGVLPKKVSADDGYTSEEGRNDLIKDGVQQVSFSGSQGKQLLSEEEWSHPDYVCARKGRSAVESLIFVLKHVFAFGRLRRRGHSEVEAELMEKVIAYNFRRMVEVRQAREGPTQKKAA